MRKKYAKTISCILLQLPALTGCQATPSSVKNKAKDYTNSKDVTVDKEEFVSVDHLLDNMDSLLKASYQNMILADTIHIEQPQSVSILQLEIPKNFANKNKVSKLSKLILGTNKYDHLIKNYKDEKWAIGNSYQISLESNTRQRQCRRFWSICCCSWQTLHYWFLRNNKYISSGLGNKTWKMQPKWKKCFSR